MERMISAWSQSKCKGRVSMKNVAQKVIIYSMVGLLHVGVFVSAAEAAAPGQNEPPRYEHRDEHRQRELEKEKERRLHEENVYHEKQMKRRPFESKKSWHERQKKENERHEKAVREIMRMGHR